MEEDILQQDVDDEIEEDMEDLEQEVEEKKPEKQPKKAKPTQQVGQQDEKQINETYEAFVYHPRLGIVNTLTGETVDGFKIGKDEAIVQLGKLILNKLDKIAIACGA